MIRPSDIAVAALTMAGGCGGWLIAQAANVPVPEFNLGTMSTSAVAVGVLWHLLKTTIPKMHEGYLAESKADREAHTAQVETLCATFTTEQRATREECRQDRMASEHRYDNLRGDLHKFRESLQAIVGRQDSQERKEATK